MTTQTVRSLSIPIAEMEWWEKFEDLRWTEKRSISKLIVEACKEYYVHHKEGNPGFTMDQFIENPDLKAVPAFFRTREAWQEYIEKLPEKDAQELLYQAQTINSLVHKKVNYGSTRASVQG